MLLPFSYALWFSSINIIGIIVIRSEKDEQKLGNKLTTDSERSPDDIGIMNDRNRSKRENENINKVH